MWTNTQQLNENRIWSPNHFVPLLKIKPVENVSMEDIQIQNDVQNTSDQLFQEDSEKSRKRKFEDEMISQPEKRKLANKLAMRKRRLNESVEQSEIRKYNEKIARKRRRMENIKTVKRSRKEERTKFETQWPSVTPHETKIRLMKRFIEEMSQKSLMQQVCGICNGIDYASKSHIVAIENIPKFKLLKLQKQNESATTTNVILSTFHQGKIVII